MFVSGRSRSQRNAPLASSARARAKRGLPKRGSRSVECSERKRLPDGAGIEWVNHLTVAGEYRLCWCAGPLGCSASEAFRVDMGELTLIGAVPLSQHRTCVSGQTCRFDGIKGIGFTSLDKVAVLDTCGVFGVVSRHISVAQTDLDLETAHHERMGLLRVEWGIMSAAGGQYRLCWCAGTHFPCATASEFESDIGGLYLVGPAPLFQDRTCISGYTCRIEGITGYGINSADTFFVMDTCGGANSGVGRFTHYGLMKVTMMNGAGALSTALSHTTVNTSDMNSTSFSVARLGGAIVTSPGGQYRLCWYAGLPPVMDSDPNATDSGEGNCTPPGVGNWTSTCPGVPRSHKYVVDLGALTLIGPAPQDQSRTCVSGLTCWLGGLQGQDLGPSDSVAILETCGVRSAVVEIFTKLDAPSPGSWASEPYVHSVEFTTPIVVSGGSYRLCWCGAGQHCETPNDFRVDFGYLTIVGPAIPQTRTCVSGRLCELKDLQGTHLSSSDFFLVLETCGDTVSSTLEGAHRHIKGMPQDGAKAVVSASGAAVSWGLTRFSAPGGVYRLCWCAGSVAPANATDATPECDQADDFRIDVGSFFLLGPELQKVHGRTCITGQTCELQGVLGVGLSDLDSYMMLDTCGVNKDALLPRASQTGRAFELREVGTTVSWGFLELTATGGTYRLCWCLRYPYMITISIILILLLL